MAKKGKRRFARIVCQNTRDGEKCKRTAKLTTVNIQNTPLAEFPQHQKFCSVCRAKTSHKFVEHKK